MGTRYRTFLRNLSHFLIFNKAEFKDNDLRMMVFSPWFNSHLVYSIQHQLKRSIYNLLKHPALLPLVDDQL